MQRKPTKWSVTRNTVSIVHAICITGVKHVRLAVFLLLYMVDIDVIYGQCL